ncbi:serine/threonine protein kinase [Halopolyspora algeriensis]|uniref:non-specific serine/threonine protein kinase n=1 Tax=Halopolyspora algeriensis TaxID=1500506 RepID=A0A368VPA9_9ACTN|nr:serine/threonine protein kinase [Halopolyspora algeriensis]TQM56391.1 serine/threonine protein kinase [Halopolyspora algeriensis]
MVDQADVGRQERVIGGRYAVTDELGRGGMGIVWRAWDQVIGREVAIKELHLPEGVPPEERQVYEERVLREARTAGRLNDPAVVTVYDVLAESGTTYIVMELVRAVTLGDLVAQRGPLPVEQVASIARQVTSALENAHAAGIVHRDVKPANIMVAEDRVKLTDFGIAQTLDDPKLTTSGAIVGSPAFMAPERLQDGEATAASDLWSLGATLFFALEGWLPFDRPTTAATLQAVLNETPRLSRPHGVLGSVVTGLLIGDPQARLSTVQLRALLDSAVGSQQTGPDSVATVAATAAYPGVSPATKVRRPGRTWITGAAAVAAVVLFAGGALVGRFALTPSKPPAMASTLTFGGGGDIRFTGIGSGDCAGGTLAPGARITSEDEVSCSDPHDIEVYTDGDVFGSSAEEISYPGEEALNRFAEGLCSSFFSSDRIVTPGKQSVLRFAALVPSRNTWEVRNRVLADDNGDNNDRGHRTVYCALYSAEGKQLRSSAQAS